MTETINKAKANAISKQDEFVTAKKMHKTEMQILTSQFGKSKRITEMMKTPLNEAKASAISKQNEFDTAKKTYETEMQILTSEFDISKKMTKMKTQELSAMTKTL